MPASSGIGGTASLNIGSFASFNIGAGLSGTSLFASANVSVLGLPIVGVGKSVGALGKIADPFASTLVGNFSDAVSSNILRSSGSIDVGSFLQSVGKDTASGFVQGQFAQTGIPTAIGVASQTSQFAGDAYGAFRDVFAPPPPPVQYGVSRVPSSGGTVAADGSVQQVSGVQVNPHAYPTRLPPTGQLLPAEGAVRLRPVRLPPVIDEAYQSQFDWINGPSRETISLGIGTLSEPDLGFTETFAGNSSGGVVRQQAAGTVASRSPFEFYADIPPIVTWIAEPVAADSQRTRSGGNAVPNSAWGQTGAVAGAFFGSIGESLSSFATGIVSAPRAIVSGDAGRALGERAVRIVSRHGDGQFDGGWNDWATWGAVITGDFLGVTSVGEGIAGVDIETGRTLNATERATRFSYGASGIASSGLGGIGIAAKVAPGTFGSLAKTGALTAKLGAMMPAGTRNLVSKAGIEDHAPSRVAGAADEFAEGTFSITEQGFKGYPAGVPRPDGPYRLIDGAEYDAARKAANSANRAIRKAGPVTLKGKEIHEIQPVKFGGSATDPANKIPLPRTLHRNEVTPWWNRMMRSIQNTGGGS